MDGATFAAEVAEEWRARIEDARERAADSEHSHAMWRLLEAAAAEPVLRALFPWTSMACLSFSTSTDFRVRGGEGFPGIVAWPAGFTVLDRPGRSSTVLLETDDPAEAVGYVVARLREGRA
ncbi:DUF6193 family natural product biosynthesis protein [Kitasatospora sp. NPDC089509]|uniref:DUF6193 family natural product biosynthesis protein n=1 Tax=Kitasatospora sp. NPDC089509 TaxID=3364079 RepID=UPI0037FBDE79